MILKFEVTNQLINRVDQEKPVADSVNYLFAHFDFITDEWKNKTVTALFTKDDTSYKMILDTNGDCLVPWEVIVNGGNVYVSCYCGSLITATKARVFIAKSGYIEDAENEQEPTPGIYNQLVERIDAVRDYTDERLLVIDGGNFTDW